LTRRTRRYSLDEDDWIGACYIDKKKRKLDKAKQATHQQDIE
jgi:hypothetical protein